MLEKLRIKQFCCCCTTRTGSLIIGVFGWMGSLLQAMTLAGSTGKEEVIETKNGLIIEKESGPNIGTILISIFMFCISLSLVVGVYKDNRKLILPWLIIKSLECGVLIIITVVVFFVLFVTEDVGPFVIIFIIIGLLAGLFFYCWICVWNFYMDLGETTLTYIPNGQTGQAFPMTEPAPQYTQFPVEEKPRSPPQEMV